MRAAETLRRFEVNGRRGRCLTTGEGSPLILLPSQLVLARTYRPTLELLARSFHIHAVEMPGCGGGARLAKPWSVEEYADWLAGFLDVICLDRASFIGHSCSGGVLLALGAIHPERVDRLVLVGTIGANPPRSLVRLLLGRAVDSLIEMSLTLRCWPDVLFNILVHPRNFMHQMNLAVQADLRNDAARVKAPTLVAWGRRDHTMPLRCAEALRAALPRGVLYVSSVGSHAWLIEHADEFARLVRDFLGRTEG